MYKVNDMIKGNNKNEDKFVFFMLLVLIMGSTWVTYMNVMNFPDVLPVGRITGISIFILISLKFGFIERMNSKFIRRHSIINSIIFYGILSAFISVSYILGTVLETLILSIFSSNNFFVVIKLVNTMVSVGEISTVYLYCMLVLAFFDFIVNTIRKTGRYFSILVLLIVVDNLKGHRILNFISNYLAYAQTSFSHYLWWNLRMIILILIFLILNRLSIKNYKLD